jgi:hypothetical protein
MIKVKAVDFRFKLKESVLFSDTEVNEIISTCGKNRSIEGIINACDNHSIKLNGMGITQLIQMDFAL